MPCIANVFDRSGTPRITSAMTTTAATGANVTPEVKDTIVGSNTGGAEAIRREEEEEEEEALV